MILRQASARQILPSSRSGLEPILIPSSLLQMELWCSLGSLAIRARTLILRQALVRQTLFQLCIWLPSVPQTMIRAHRIIAGFPS